MPESVEDIDQVPPELVTQDAAGRYLFRQPARSRESTRRMAVSRRPFGAASPTTMPCR